VFFSEYSGFPRITSAVLLLRLLTYHQSNIALAIASVAKLISLKIQRQERMEAICLCSLMRLLNGSRFQNWKWPQVYRENNLVLELLAVTTKCARMKFS
jgi:hypothetical protein